MAANNNTFIERLGDLDTQFEALSEAADLTDEQVLGLVDKLDSPNQVLQAGIVSLVAQRPEITIPILVDGLGADSQFIQGNSKNALSAIGTPATDSLLAALASTNAAKAQNAQDVLIGFGAAIKDSVQAAIEDCGDQVPMPLAALYLSVEPTAIRSLEAQIIASLSSPNQILAAAAVQACVQGKPSSIDLLIGSMGAANPFLQQNATNALIQIGDDAIEPLIEALASPSQIVQGNGVRALSSMGAKAIEPLQAALEHDDQLVRQNAASALTTVKQAAKSSKKSGGLFRMFGG